jgi:hypothetical protein
MPQVRENRGAAPGNQDGKGGARDERGLPPIQHTGTAISMLSAQENLAFKIDNLALVHSISEQRSLVLFQDRENVLPSRELRLFQGISNRIFVAF